MVKVVDVVYLEAEMYFLDASRKDCLIRCRTNAVPVSIFEIGCLGLFKCFTASESG